MWQRVHDALRDTVRVHAGRDALPTAAVIDSRTVACRGHGVLHERRLDAGKKTKGRKRHIATDTGGLLLAVVVTAASIQDRRRASLVLTALHERASTVRHVWADGGYAARLATWAATVLSLTVQIVRRTDRTAGFVVLPRRWVVERTYDWINKHRWCVSD